MGNIILIGFMGTGKTTAGKILAYRLGRIFIDVDAEIENNCSMKVHEIFAVYGEPFFREQERLAIKHVLNYNNAVIATGGGAVLASENAARLKRCGVVIALQAAPEIILRRLANCNTLRPLLNTPDKLQVITTMLQERAPRYEIANFRVETSNLTPWEVTEKIIDFLHLATEGPKE